MNYLYYADNLEYPKSDWSFSPDEKFPEYLYDEVSSEKNDVYRAIRKMFYELELDAENYGTAAWNPLGAYIKPGDCVLLKPNLVMHRNGSDDTDDMDCLVTHPSVIRCVADYCFLALKGKGRVVVGDAPVKDCDFKLLLEKHQYNMLSEFYHKRNIVLDFLDFRGPEEETCISCSTGVGITVNLGKQSYFYNCNHNEKLYRIPNYDCDRVVTHHSGETQEYMINSIVLNADVIISLPKPKTHRKNGYTGALKNFVGINYSKEYLPHHTQGAVKNGGDEYLENYFWAKTASRMRIACDKNRVKGCCLRQRKENSFRLKINQIGKFILRKCYSCANHIDTFLTKDRDRISQMREGSWYGNDTLWRSVLDLNLCVMYADRAGVIQNTAQRRILHLGDMIISGEKEGPLAPSPKKQHMLLFSENAVEFDRILVKIMGYDYKKFVGLWEAMKSRALCGVDEKYYLQSNENKWEGEVDNINFAKEIRSFEPSRGWKGYVEL